MKSQVRSSPSASFDALSPKSLWAGDAHVHVHVGYCYCPGYAGEPGAYDPYVCDDYEPNDYPEDLKNGYLAYLDGKALELGNELRANLAKGEARSWHCWKDFWDSYWKSYSSDVEKGLAPRKVALEAWVAYWSPRIPAGDFAPPRYNDHEVFSVKDAVGMARAESLKWVILTPHANERQNRLDYFWDSLKREIAHYQRLEENQGIVILLGVEGYLFKERRGSRPGPAKVLGHVLLFGNTEYFSFQHDRARDPRRLPRKEGAEDAIDTLEELADLVMRDDRVAVFVSHPVKGIVVFKSGTEKLSLGEQFFFIDRDRLDCRVGLELINGVKYATGDVIDWLWDRYLLAGRRIPAIADSDTEAGRVRKPGTNLNYLYLDSVPEIRSEPAGPHEIVDALRAGSNCASKRVIYGMLDFDCYIYTYVQCGEVKYWPGERISTRNLSADPDLEVVAVCNFSRPGVQLPVRPVFRMIYQHPGLHGTDEFEYLAGSNSKRLSIGRTTHRLRFAPDANYVRWDGKTVTNGSYIRIESTLMGNYIALTNPIFFG